MFDPVVHHRLALIRQQEIIDSARDRRRDSVETLIRQSTVEDMLALYHQQAALEMLARVNPLRLLRALFALFTTFAALVRARRTVNTRQSNSTVYAAECCEWEGGNAS
jgi:hypothetical protein